jgi:hypothetical protein
MSLTHDDLQAIRAIIEETINPVRGDIEALSNDVKEIYGMLADPQKQNKHWRKNSTPSFRTNWSSKAGWRDTAKPLVDMHIQQQPGVFHISSMSFLGCSIFKSLE